MLEDYIKEWSVDALINEKNIAHLSIDVPRLHQKYLGHLSLERRKLRKLQEKIKSLKSTLEDYYLGVIDGRDINRSPHQIKETRTSAERKVESDSDVIKHNLALIEQEEIVLFLKEVITNINKRSFDIKNHIDYLKFLGGN